MLIPLVELMETETNFGTNFVSLLKIPSGVILKSYGIIRSIPLRIRDSEYRLDFHIYDVSEMSRLIGLPLGTLFQERPK